MDTYGNTYMGASYNPPNNWKGINNE
jgi:hypothetical protein